MGAMNFQQVTDPVCGMSVNPERTFCFALHKGRKYYFCSPRCQDEFNKELDKFGSSPKSFSAVSWTACPRRTKGSSAPAVLAAIEGRDMAGSAPARISPVQAVDMSMFMVNFLIIGPKEPKEIS